MMLRMDAPIVLAIAGLVVAVATPAMAVPVFADADSGIAASAVMYATFHGTIDKPTSFYVILGTDGTIRYQFCVIYGDKPEKWESLDVDWPVPFEEIADWTPNPSFGLLEREIPEILPGMITTRDGDVWRLEIEWKRPAWDSPGMVEVGSTRWQQLTCEDCKKD